MTAQELLLEHTHVLVYPELPRYYTADEPRRFAALLLALTWVVELPATIPRAIADPDDDRGIACAVVGDADAMVSGDQDLLALGSTGDIQVRSPAALLGRLEREGREDTQQ